MDLSGKTALVTGSATGLGAATALKLAEAGANVVINYSRSAAEAEATADAIRAKGAQVVVVQADVGSDAQCRQLAAAAAPWGRLDMLINNVGQTKHVPNHADLDGLTDEDFLRLYRLNVVSAFQMVRACRDLLEAAYQSTGLASSVVNISSIAGVTGIGSSIAYAATKGALNTMTLSLARALAPKIRVNALCPGFIDTRWFPDAYGAETAARIRNNVASTVPLRAASTAEDVADAAVFFASPMSRHVTGETLIVDAGLHLGYAPLAAR